jgi:hypothetical protein
MVTPKLSPLVSTSGVTWFPAVEVDPATALLAPEEVGTLTFRLPLPENLPCDSYNGVLCLQGFRENGIPVTITVAMSGRLAKTRENKKRRPRKTSTPKTRKRV